MANTPIKNPNSVSYSSYDITSFYAESGVTLTSGKITLHKVGNVLYITTNGKITIPELAQNAYKQLASIPDSFKPYVQVSVPIQIIGRANSNMKLNISPIEGLMLNAYAATEAVNDSYFYLGTCSAGFRLGG